VVVDMIENKVKQLIIAKYGSVKKFADKIKVPYTTIDTILKRGFLNSNVLNVIKICNELGINIDDLANGKVVFK
jgi:DNA-binding Xre family transcriptional regulator